MKIIIAILGVMSAFGPLSIDMYLPSLPTIAQDFGIPLARVQYSLASYFVGLAVGQIFYGPITDRYGRKKPLYFGMILYGLASLGCATATNVEELIFYRFLQALGACAGIVISRAIVRDKFHAREAARVFSLLMLIMGIAPILAPLGGGYIATQVGWRFIFWILVVLSSLMLLCQFFFLPETHVDPKKNSPKEILRIYQGILKSRPFVGNTMASAFAQAGMFAYITGSPWVFMNHFGLSPAHYAWVFGSNAFGLILFSQINAKLLKKNGPGDILKRVYPFLATVSVCLLIAGVMDASFWVILPLLFLFISCLGMTSPNSTASALATQGHYAGSASALMGTMQFTTSATISALVSYIHNDTLIPMTGILGICGVMALLIYRLVATEPVEAL
jgi:MFS transporter, DHA1 family, multidrug resistance protein